METGANFVQLTKTQKNINSAIHAIQRSAAKTQSLKLAALAVQMRKAGHFDKVIKAIDDMIQTLADEGNDDKEKRDECKEKTHRKSEEKYTLEHKIERNGKDIKINITKKEKLEEDIELTSENIRQTKSDLKQMTEDREAEHAAFLQAKEDDENAVALLAQAIGHLSSYLDANKVDMGSLQSGRQGGVFTQEPEFEVSEDQAPETTFAGKDDNKQESKGIVSILTMLKEDLQDEITNGVKADAEAEKLFQENKTAAEKLLSELRDKRVNLKAEKADTEATIADTEELKKTNEGKLEAKEEELATLKPGCDWINENFTKRAEFRASEREGLAQAKAILSGMKTSLIAKKSHMSHGFNDRAFGSAIARMSFLQRK
jgi:chromosome segregation ATPase